MKTHLISSIDAESLFVSFWFLLSKAESIFDKIFEIDSLDFSFSIFNSRFSISQVSLNIQQCHQFEELTNSEYQKIRRIKYPFEISRNSRTNPNSPVWLSNTSGPIKIVFFESCTFSFLHCVNFELLIKSDDAFISITNHSENVIFYHCKCFQTENDNLRLKF